MYKRWNTRKNLKMLGPLYSTISILQFWELVLQIFVLLVEQDCCFTRVLLQVIQSMKANDWFSHCITLLILLGYWNSKTIVLLSKNTPCQSIIAVVLMQCFGIICSLQIPLNQNSCISLYWDSDPAYILLEIVILSPSLHQNSWVPFI